MKAILMAGGFGTRLRPLTVNVPKPMAPMVNRPMMEHTIRLLKQHGFDDLLIMLYYQPDVVIRHFGDGTAFGVRIQYLRPTADLGTAGCVKFAQSFLDEDFLVISGDLLTDFNLSSVAKFHEEQKAMATLVLTRAVNPLAYGVVIVNAEERIQRFLEKPSWGEVFSDTINTGIYMLKPEVLHHIPDDRSFDFSKDLFPRLLDLKAPLFGHVAKGYWKDVGDLTEYRLAHYDILDRTIAVEPLGGVTRRGNLEFELGPSVSLPERLLGDGRSVIGEGCVIENDVKLSRCVLGNRVRVMAGAELSGCVIWDDCVIGSGARLQEAVVGARTKISQNAQLSEGVIVGDDCTLGEDVVIHANVKIWPNKIVEDGAILSTSLIWGDKWSSRLFGSYGITGLCNREITPELATRIGAAYGAYLGEGSYVTTSRDAPMASRMIKRALISGLLSSGVKVGDLRTAPIPVVRYEVGVEGEAGGVHVRQSPFDPNVVDIKLLDKTGVDLSIQQERAIEQLFLREDFKRASPDRVGEITTPPRAQEYYRAGFLKSIDTALLQKTKLKIVVDYAFSSACLILPDILGRLGLEVVSLNAYMSPQRGTKTPADFQASLDQLATLVTTLKADAGFLIDTGAEKVFLIDDKGQRIPNESALLMVAQLMMKQQPGLRIGVPVTVSRVIETLAQPSKTFIQRLRTAPRYIMDAAREQGMGFVGDGVGGFIFPNFQPCFDAMFAIAKIAELLAREKTSLHAWVQQIPPSQTLHQKVPCPWDRKGLVMRRAIEAVQPYLHELIDGVKVYPNDSWVLLLPDPDEASFHVWAEGASQAQTHQLIQEYTQKVKRWQEN